MSPPHLDATRPRTTLAVTLRRLLEDLSRKPIADRVGWQVTRDVDPVVRRTAAHAQGVVPLGLRREDVL